MFGLKEVFESVIPSRNKTSKTSNELVANFSIGKKDNIREEWEHRLNKINEELEILLKSPASRSNNIKIARLVEKKRKLENELMFL